MSVIVSTPEQLASLIEQAVKNAVAGLTQNDPDELGGVELAARVTELSESTIYKLVSRRAIPHSRRANRLYFLKSELVSWAMSGSRPLK